MSRNSKKLKPRKKLLCIISIVFMFVSIFVSVGVITEEVCAASAIGDITRDNNSPKILFKALEHTYRTRPDDKVFAVGDFIPLKLKFRILEDIRNPVIAIDMNVRKQHDPIKGDEKSGFILSEIKTGTSINKNMFKVSKENGISEIINDFDVSVENTETDKKLKIIVPGSFEQNDVLQISYNVKVTAYSSVFDIGIRKYLETNALNNVDMCIYYELSEIDDLGHIISGIYSKDSTSDDSEKLKFKVDIKLEDPILFE